MSTVIPIPPKTWTNCGGAGGAYFQWTGAESISINDVAGTDSNDGIDHYAVDTQPRGTVSWGLGSDMWVWSDTAASIRRLV